MPKTLVFLLIFLSVYSWNGRSTTPRLGFVRIGQQIDPVEEGIDQEVPKASVVYRIGWGGSANVYRIIPPDGKIFVLKKYKVPGSAFQDLKALKDLRAALKGSDVEFEVVEASLRKKTVSILKLNNVEGADLNEASQQIRKTDAALNAELWSRYKVALEKTLERLQKQFWRVRQVGAYIYYKRYFFCEERLLLLKPDNVLVRESDLALVVSDPE